MWMLRVPFITALALAWIVSASSARAEDPPPAGKGTASPAAKSGDVAPRSKRVDIEQYKKQYWSQGEDYNVVQNRIYKKANRFSLRAFGGFTDTDPFISVKNAGGALSYNFSENFALTALGWRSWTGKSTALQIYEKENTNTTNYNGVDGFAGGEIEYGVIYGKVSLFGRRILHFDLGVTLGMGVTFTDTGKYITPTFGVNQMFFLSNHFGLRVEYRVTYYKEDLPDREAKYPKDTPPFKLLGESRANWSNIIMFGFSVFP